MNVYVAYSPLLRKLQPGFKNNASIFFSLLRDDVKGLFGRGNVILLQKQVKKALAKLKR